MLRVILRIALGLLVTMAMHQVAAAQVTSSTAQLNVTASPPTLPNSVTTAAPTTLTSALPAAGTSSPIVTPAAVAAATSAPTLVAQVPMAPPAAPANCAGVSPYDNYSCLDAYLGDDVLGRLFNYYKLEWGQPGPPTDPNAPSSRIDGWPRTPATTPPMAYTEWPTGALTSIGVTRPSGADSPFMVAIANTWLGQTLNDNNFQIYGWLNPGFNLSTNQNKAGNAPIAYTVNPNSIQLDQAVLYLDRWPDTVQTDHFDWGMRLSVLYGENYRYTNSYGIASWQFNGDNRLNGFDFPMMYADFYWPSSFVAGIPVEVRVGRYISIPDIEAQLAPNNLTYTHSLTYGWDNYTNTGVVASWQITPNILLQTGITDGTETPLWHYNQTRPNLFPNASYPNSTYLTDPGNQPSGTLCMRFVWNDGYDTFYPCLDGINNGQWGYNNIQWHGFTYYHRFNDQWHLDYETYYLSERGVFNVQNPTALAIYDAGGTPFSPQNIPINSTNLAYCSNPALIRCNVSAVGVLAYLNYTPDPLNNFSYRAEVYYDPNGWRTGTGAYTRYAEATVSWQHWLSPQVEMRPELSYWRSFDTAAFNSAIYSGPIVGNRHDTFEFAADLIFHF
jgi:hypothetical protein